VHILQPFSNRRFGEKIRLVARAFLNLLLGGGYGLIIFK
jgi:hypothetical protein